MRSVSWGMIRRIPNLTVIRRSSDDARDIVRFLDYAREYLYTIPHQIKQYRSRRPADGEAVVTEGK